ncbi:TrbC/VirB2 family protein [Anaplasmataceae bacterium AB001_6]|nr:TrbC/VirB2 family protein [Anaplasmataceae bacterium AB001_6]
MDLLNSIGVGRFQMKGYGEDLNLQNRLFLFLFLFLAYYCNVDCALAEAFDEKSADSIIKQLFCNVQNIVSGTVAQGVAVLIIAITGYSFFMGKISTSMLFIISGGILLVFGAPAIIPAITKGLSASGESFEDCSVFDSGIGA